MTLKGRVLDVGFGELILAGELLEGLKGQIQYTGIDPDKRVHAAAGARHPDAVLFNSSLAG